MDSNQLLDTARDQLAPSGVLRAGINMSNFLLVNAKADNGDPAGVSPDMAKALAKKLGVGLELKPYPGPGLVADAAADREWDIANIAAEAERAKVIQFSPPYCEIQATYLLPPNSLISSLAEVDRPGNRISVKARAAYDLWLSENLQHAQLERSDSMDDSYTRFVEESMDALAGLRPRLLSDLENLPGSTLLHDSFTAVQQCIGCIPGHAEAAAFISQFVQEAIASGYVATLLEKYDVVGKLSVAPKQSTSTSA